MLRRARRPAPAPIVLPAAASALLIVGAIVVLSDGGVDAFTLLVLTCVVVGITAAFADPVALTLVVVIAEFTAIGFARRPYAQLRGGPHAWHAALVLIGAALPVYLVASYLRWLRLSREVTTEGAETRRRSGSVFELRAAIGRRRQYAAFGVAAATLPSLTALLASLRMDLSIADELLLYLLVVVAVSLLGGFWPAVLTATASGLLLNWYFTSPLHTFTISEPRNLLALLLFIAVAVTVSSVVHLGAQRARLAARSTAEAQSLLTLAQTVLAGADTPSSVLEQLTDRGGVLAQLLELVAGCWVEVASSGSRDGQAGSPSIVLTPRPDLRLRVTGFVADISPTVLEGVAAQAAAALDRQRLRSQAAQAEALTEANHVRTALLTAVSHDLRTPLASIKAAITSLRQSEVAWAPADEAALLETIEDGSDRLEHLINNLLDMSRVQSGSLEPFLRPTAIDEVVPLALRGLRGGQPIVLALPEDLPLVATDASLLERVLANLAANALRFSPAHSPAEIAAEADARQVRIRVIDHGRGVPAHVLDRIFEPFQRFDDGASEGGVGLGLAVARGLTEAMGGTVTASATAGGGLTVTVTVDRSFSRLGE